MIFAADCVVSVGDGEGQGSDVLMTVLVKKNVSDPSVECAEMDGADTRQRVQGRTFSLLMSALIIACRPASEKVRVVM